MIQQTINIIKTYVQNNLVDLIPAPVEEHVKALPVDGAQADALPIIGIYQGSIAPGKESKDRVTPIEGTGFAIDREFEQHLMVDVFADDMLLCEKIASIIINILSTEHDSIINATNNNSELEYRSGPYCTRNMVLAIRFQEGVPSYADSLCSMQLVFLISGSIGMLKETTEGMEKIQEVVVEQLVD